MDEFPNVIREQAREPRVVQFDGKRYSIRMEAVFWRVLERLAAYRQIRVGKLIGELAETAGAENLTSLLRVYCMLETERQMAKTVLTTPVRGLFEVIGASPVPAAVLSRERTVIAFNRALAEWLDAGKSLNVGDDLGKVFEIRAATSFSETWRALLFGTIGRARARLIYVVPGRVATVEATFVYCGKPRDRNAYVVIWLDTAPKTGKKPPPANAPEQAKRGQAGPDA